MAWLAMLDELDRIAMACILVAPGRLLGMEDACEVALRTIDRLQRENGGGSDFVLRSIATVRAYIENLPTERAAREKAARGLRAELSVLRNLLQDAERVARRNA